MSPDFEWKNEYSTGLRDIDVQHELFLNLIRLSYESHMEPDGSPRVIHILSELERYAQFHFRSEELLMQLYHYPQYIDQKQEHEKLMSILKVKLEYVRKNMNDLPDLILFLIKWLVNHTCLDDKAMGKFISRRRQF